MERNSDMAQTANMNMGSWMSFGWTVTSAHIPEVLTAPLWPVPTEGLCVEDEMDLATARMKLMEAERDSSRLVRGEELRARLDDLET